MVFSPRTLLVCSLLALPALARAQPQPHPPPRFNASDGSTGGLSVVDATGGAPDSFRLFLALDHAPADDFLRAGADVAQSRQSVSFSWTPLEHLELFAALRTRGTSTEGLAPSSLYTLGEPLVGLKAFFDTLRPLHLGAGLHLALRSDGGGSVPRPEATGIGLRGAASLDLRDLASPTPFVARLNVEYLFDNSAAIVEDAERARYRQLGNPAPHADEDRHLVTRFERYALDVSRVDRLGIGVGLEVPTQVTERFSLHPLLEWRLGVPVNRQGYDCPRFPLDPDADEAGTRTSDTDSCLVDAGFESWPMNLAAGLRVAPPVRGFSFSVAVDWGLGGTRFIHEVAPNSPLTVLVAIGYEHDARPTAPVVVRVPTPTPPPPRGRVTGVVEDAQTGQPIAGATLRVRGLELGALASAADGRFAGYEVAPGEVVLELAHAEYAPGTCTARIPEAGGDADTRCKLTALPTHASIDGRVVDAFGAPISGVLVELTGPAAATLSSDANGAFTRGELPVGRYRVDVRSRVHLTRRLEITLERRQALRVEVVLVSRPARSGLRVEPQAVKAPALRFATDSVELSQEAALAVAELADWLLGEGAAVRVRILVGGDETRALTRAQEVARRLVRAGVDATRVETAAGAGADRVEIAIVE